MRHRGGKTAPIWTWGEGGAGEGAAPVGLTLRKIPQIPHWGPYQIENMRPWGYAFGWSLVSVRIRALDAPRLDIPGRGWGWSRRPKNERIRNCGRTAFPSRLPSRPMLACHRPPCCLTSGQCGAPTSGLGAAVAIVVGADPPGDHRGLCLVPQKLKAGPDRESWRWGCTCGHCHRCGRWGRWYAGAPPTWRSLRLCGNHLPVRTLIKAYAAIMFL